MGLDMYLYKVSKSSFLVEGKVYDRKELNLIPNLNCVDLDCACNTIKKNGTLIKCIEKVYTLEGIANEAGVKDVAKRFCIVGQKFSSKESTTTFHLYNDENEKVGEYTFNHENHEVENRITKDKEFEYIAFICEQIDYQRKGLSDYGWSCLPENCEYCDDIEVIENLVKGGLSESFLDKWVDNKTVFYPWW